LNPPGFFLSSDKIGINPISFAGSGNHIKKGNYLATEVTESTEIQQLKKERNVTLTLKTYL
jgi:hypothetical protein